MISLRYSISREDYIRFYTWVMWDNPENKARRIRYYLWQLLPPLGFLLAFYYTGLFDRQSSFILIIGVALLLTTSMSLMNMRINTQKTASKTADDPGNASLFQEKNITISDQGIQIREAYAETMYQWNAFTRKMETTDAVYLFLNKIQAIIIPKKAFPDGQSLRNFQQMLARHISLDAEIGHLMKS